jgi:hypothetical protein
MNIKEKDVNTFTYEGRDNMIDFNSDKIPPVHKDFIAQLKLKNGKTINAPSKWRKKIWKWWYEVRKDEIETNVLVSVSNQMLGRK